MNWIWLGIQIKQNPSPKLNKQKIIMCDKLVWKKPTLNHSNDHPTQQQLMHKQGVFRCWLFKKQFTTVFNRGNSFVE